MSWEAAIYLKPSRIKKGQKDFQVHCFQWFFTAESCEKDKKNGAPGNFFGPSYFETALVLLKEYCGLHSEMEVQHKYRRKK